MTALNAPLFSVTPGSVRDAMIQVFTREKESAKTKISKFRFDISIDPVHALTWADSIFVEAARQKVASTIIDLLMGGCTIDELRDNLTQAVIYGAKYIPISTSNSSNYMKQCETSANASALDRLKIVNKLDCYQADETVKNNIHLVRGFHQMNVQ